MPAYALPHWLDPLAVAQHFCAHEQSYALLHSSRADEKYATQSILAFEPLEQISGEDYSVLTAHLRADAPRWEHAWFGYLGYELKHTTERLSATAPSFIETPRLLLTRYAQVLVFDHTNRHISLHSADDTILNAWPEKTELTFNDACKVADIRSNMSKDEYLLHVQAMLEDIHAGKYYQANMTRKFMGELAETANPLTLFSSLCELSPAPFSALIVTPECAIISSSPERFIKVDGGRICSEPIKGSAPRGKSAEADARMLETLKASRKDHAENLMIVDLIRHDLSRVCESGSVETPEISALHSFANVHHLISRIEGTLKKDMGMADVLATTFPPGSMTGAPKIAAMEACAAHEGMDRGVYSGALGWFGGDGSCDLSVVIRTLITQGKRFEFQVGGGIVADSKPEAEWLETLAKASALCKLLGTDISAL